MAEDENRPPDESLSSRRRAERRRGEPPIIDARASAVPTMPDEEAAAAGPPAVPSGLDPSAGRPAPSERAEPVLFGGAWREAAPNIEASDAGATGGSPETPAVDPGREPASGGPDEDAAARGVSEAYAEAAPPRPAVRRGFLGPLAALLGVVTLLLLGTIVWLLATEGRRSRSGEVAAALGALNERVAALEGRPDPAGAVGDISALDARVGALDAAGGELTKRLSDVQAKLESIAQDVTTLRAAAAAAAASPPPEASAATATDVAALQGKIVDLEARVSDVAAKPEPAPPPPVDLGPVDRKIADLQNRLAALRAEVAAIPTTDLQPLENASTTLSRRLSATEASLRAEVAAIPKTDLQPLEGATNAVSERLSAVEKALAAPKPVDPDLIRRLDANAAVAKTAALASVGEELARKLESGQPFVRELGALRALGADRAALDVVAPLAPGGAPTVAALKAQWDEARDGALAASAPERQGDVVHRLVSGARDLVRIHRTGVEHSNADTLADASQVDAALDRGDLSGALAAWGMLPEAARQVSLTWAEAAQARIRAGEAARTVTAEALAALGQPKP